MRDRSEPLSTEDAETFCYRFVCRDCHQTVALTREHTVWYQRRIARETEAGRQFAWPKRCADCRSYRRSEAESGLSR